MAVAVVYDFEGATRDQYDQVIEKMGLAPGGPAAPGSLFHWVTGRDKGIRVVDVWETKQQFEQFGAEQVGPITQEVGFPSAPEIEFADVHNYLTTP